MSASQQTTVLFTGYAPVHFACFRPLYERFSTIPEYRVLLSGGLRTKTDDGYVYDQPGLFNPFGIADDRIVPVEELDSLDVEFLFAANTKMILPRSVGTRVQIFHGISFRNRAVREDNLQNDVFFVVGPYMHRAFDRAGLLTLDDPRGLKIGFPKTDRLLDDSLNRTEILNKCGFSGERPVLLYAPTGQRHNSLETMGRDVIQALAATDQFDLLIKPHDHPKDTSVDWFEELAPLENEHLRVSREPDVIPLLYAADLLITDASSVSSEFSLLDRPMVFLDVPKLIAKTQRRDGSMVDLEQWGRRGGLIVEKPDHVVGAVERSLSDPSEFSSIRTAMAQDLFYNPGRSVAAAQQWLQQQTQVAA